MRTLYTKKKKKSACLTKVRQHKDKKSQECQHKYQEEVMNKGEEKKSQNESNPWSVYLGYIWGF